MNKLHIGCGHDYKEGYINVDCDSNVKTDWCGDACYMPRGYRRRSERQDDKDIDWTDHFDHIYSHHSLEHFHNLFQIVDEMARVSKDGATWEHTVPYCTWTQGWGNPHHHILFHENTFRFFDKGPNGIHKRREQDYSIETVKVEYGYSAESISKDYPLDWQRKHLLNVIEEITFHLICRK